MGSDITGGAYGPGVRPYASTDAGNWMRQNVPKPFRAQPGQAAAPGIRPRHQSPFPAQPPKTAATPSAAMGQPDQAPANPVDINPGNILGRLSAESRYNANSSSGTTNRAVQDLQAGALAQNRANVNLGLEAQNAQLNMQQQANRSAAYQQALSNQARINSDLSQREISQIGLSTQLQEAMIRNQLNLITALLQEA